jgi:hypothetical protein
MRLASLSFVAATHVLSFWSDNQPTAPVDPSNTYLACVESDIIRAVGAFEEKTDHLRFKSLWFSPSATFEEKEAVMDLILKDKMIIPELPELRRQNAHAYLDYIFYSDNSEGEDFDGDSG